MQFFSTLFHLIRSLIVSRLTLSMEFLALRQQLAVLNRAVHRPKLRRRDRFFWVVLSHYGAGGARSWSSSDPKPSSSGIAMAFGSTGSGNRGRGPSGVRRSPRRSEN